MFHEVKNCRICGNTNLVGILQLGVQYLTGVFPPRQDNSITCGPLELVKCHGANACGLVQLRHSYESAEMYGENYGYRSSLNKSMVQHLREKVRLVGSMVKLQRGDVVVDIGSNDGTTLSFYEQPDIKLVGIDPSAAKFRQYYKPHIELITDFFSAAQYQSRFGDRKAKIVTSIAMFYDLEQPVQFMAQVEQILADDGIWHFEQSYLPAMLATTSYDTVCHEHLEYYSLAQILYATKLTGLKILDVSFNAINGGSFAVTVAKAGSAHQPNQGVIDRTIASEKTLGLDTLEPYIRFSEAAIAHRQQLLQCLADFKARGQTVLGYGASTKGNVLLQYCGVTQEQLPAIAEVNQDKFGHVTPGTWIPIISEKQAHDMKPDAFLVLPWHFRDNLLARETAYLRAGGKMIFPLPQIEIIGS